MVMKSLFENKKIHSDVTRILCSIVHGDGGVFMGGILAHDPTLLSKPNQPYGHAWEGIYPLPYGRGDSARMLFVKSILIDETCEIPNM